MSGVLYRITVKRLVLAVSPSCLLYMWCLLTVKHSRIKAVLWGWTVSVTGAKLAVNGQLISPKPQGLIVMNPQ